MATPLIDRKGGLQLPNNYRRAIVDIVHTWTNDGKVSLTRWPSVSAWIRSMAKVGHQKLVLEGRVKDNNKIR